MKIGGWTGGMAAQRTSLAQRGRLCWAKGQRRREVERRMGRGERRVGRAASAEGCGHLACTGLSAAQPDHGGRRLDEGRATAPLPPPRRRLPQGATESATSERAKESASPQRPAGLESPASRSDWDARAHTHPQPHPPAATPTLAPRAPFSAPCHPCRASRWCARPAGGGGGKAVAGAHRPRRVDRLLGRRVRACGAVRKSTSRGAPRTRTTKRR